MSEGTWIKSSRCDTSACAEAQGVEDGVLLRSSLAPSTVLKVSKDQWDRLVDYFSHVGDPMDG